MMEAKKLKKIMTDLAAGRITREEADKLVAKPKPKKAHKRKNKHGEVK
jgi:hypothetical protein